MSSAGVIEITGLRKEYRRFRRAPTVALDGLDLSVPEGGVFGFLGPNGSGKTTTIRCLLGLARSSAGSCRLLGVETPAQLPAVIAQVGSIVETPTLYPMFTGRRNLALLAGLSGIGPRRVDEVLARVGLAERADDRVKAYSLGMRQRLGVAAALLKDPAVLILDEPANGLDPAGIVEIRKLLRSLGDEGRTVFVSSHILNEIEQTCDHVAILNRGRCVASGAVRDVLVARGGATMQVTVADLAAGAAVLREAGFDASTDGGSILVAASADQGAAVSEALGRRELWVSELRVREVSLEDVFLEITGENHADLPPPAGAPR